MKSNLERIQTDLEELIALGDQLHNSIQFECFPEDFAATVKQKLGPKAKKFLEGLPSFAEKYQVWYSEAIAVVKLILPDRLPDFVRYYEKTKGRKDISHESYVIADNLDGLRVTRGYAKEKVVGPEAAIPKFRQQLNILKSARRKFESSLFDIQQLVQADLFDSELDAAKELNKKGFARGAGAIAGVVLEKHLRSVCDNHGLTTRKKSPSINDFNQLLKDSDIIEIKDWRFIQRLGDLRNLCDHNKDTEPTKEDVEELIVGTDKVIKRIF